MFIAEDSTNGSTASRSGLVRDPDRRALPAPHPELPDDRAEPAVGRRRLRGRVRRPGGGAGRMDDYRSARAQPRLLASASGEESTEPPRSCASGWPDGRPETLAILVRVSQRDRVVTGLSERGPRARGRPRRDQTRPTGCDDDAPGEGHRVLEGVVVRGERGVDPGC